MLIKVVKEGGYGGVEERYSNVFAELEPCSLTDLKRCIASVDAFLGLLWNDGMDFRVKLMDYAKVEADVAEFCRYYARWLGDPLAERLKHEINQVLEKAVNWWGRQETYDAMER